MLTSLRFIARSLAAGLVFLLALPHAFADGPAFGMNSLPTTRPICIGYLNALRSATGGGTSYTPSELVTEMNSLNWAGFDAVVQAFAEPKADGSIGEGLGNFSAYQAPLLAAAHARGKAVILSIGGAYPPKLASQFATIAADPTLRQTFSQNVTSYIVAKGYDGVDIDWEFPDYPTGRANMTLLMQALHSAVKAANSNFIVMFATGPGYYMGSYDFAARSPYTDFYFYFGYDWKNPQNGPMTYPGSTQYTTADDQLPEASVRGGIQYVLNKGFPAAKIICGLQFYGSLNTS
ncbi:MAG: glycoside hydrolase family 18 protein [Chthoniobacterales bacterium]